MGYVHSFAPGKKKITQKRWSQVLADCQRIIERSPVDVAVEQTGATMLVHGTEPDACEPLVIPKKVTDIAATDCKTNQHPYDVVVVACLCLFAEAGLEITSSGNAFEWSEGCLLARTAVGRRIANPIGDAGEDKPSIHGLGWVPPKISQAESILHPLVAYAFQGAFESLSPEQRSDVSLVSTQAKFLGNRLVYACGTIEDLEAMATELKQLSPTTAEQVSELESASGVPWSRDTAMTRALRSAIADMATAVTTRINWEKNKLVNKSK